GFLLIRNRDLGFNSACPSMVPALHRSPAFHLRLYSFNLAGASSPTWFRLCQLPRKLMRYAYHIEHGPSASASALIPSESHCLLHPPEYTTRAKPLFLVGNRSVGNNDEQNRIEIVEGHVACFGISPDCLLVEKPSWILLEDASVLLLQLGPYT